MIAAITTIIQVKVRKEIHETLLRFQGLIESEATNQGAWLTESAGVLIDLHTSVLQSLCGKASHASPCCQPSQSDITRARSITMDADAETNSIRLDRADGQKERCLSAGGSAVLESTLSQRDNETVGMDVNRGESLERGRTTDNEQGRRLRDLGRMLAYKRQFAASRKVRCADDTDSTLIRGAWVVIRECFILRN